MDTAADCIVEIDGDGTLLTAIRPPHNYSVTPPMKWPARTPCLDAGVCRIMQKDEAQWSVETGGGKIPRGAGTYAVQKDGGIIPVELRGAEKRSAKAHLYRYRAYYAAQQLENKLKQLVDDLRESDRRKDEFLATLSHERAIPGSHPQCRVYSPQRRSYRRQISLVLRNARQTGGSHERLLEDCSTWVESPGAAFCCARNGSIS